MIKLSVIIITLNEEKNIKRCLTSVKDLADEILVLDSYSTDKTKEIAESFGAKVIQKKFEGYVKARREVESHAQYDYILAIDADETLSPELANSILELKSNWTEEAYTVARKTNYCGKWINHSGWYPDRKLRLYKRGSGRWEGKYVHEKYNLFSKENGKRLSGDLLHYSYYKQEDHWNRTDKYAELSAQELFEAKQKGFYLFAYLKAIIKFVRVYFINLGFLDGREGYIICKVTAWGTYKKYEKLIHLYQNQKKTGFQKVEFSQYLQSSQTGKFSIIIPSWNNLEYLKLCLSGLRKNSTFKNQIIVAVNEGKDGSIEWLKAQKDIDFVHATTNQGVCYAVNACRPLVRTDYIVYMNDDMYTCPEWDKILFDEIQKQPGNDFFLSATLIEPIKNKNPNYVAIIKNYGQEVESFKEDDLLKEYAGLAVKNWRGSSWPPNVVHKNTWDLVGGYSTEFTPGMYSDPDFSMKLWQAGIRRLYGVGNSLVYHFGEKTTGRVKKNKGADTFLHKWKITAHTYYSIYLKLGKPYEGAYAEQIHLSLYSQIRNTLKRILKSF